MADDVEELGRLLYEAMLSRIPPERRATNGTPALYEWGTQPESLRQDWYAVARVARRYCGIK